MIKFNSNIQIEGNDYLAGTTKEDVPDNVKNHWYFKHLVEIGDIVEDKPLAKTTKSKE
jgi:hypothetical protein